MQQDIKQAIIDGVKKPLHDYDVAFQILSEIGREIEQTLENDTERMLDIRKKFDNLSAAVELEFEGTAVFEQEIKKTKDLLVQSVDNVHASLDVSNQITIDLENISQYFDRIHANGVQLEHLIKDINVVSDSIEVASRNAGITAFHAGHQGRGFEVIAREMTTLVKSVQQPSKKIPDLANGIIKQAVELGNDLLRISNIMYDLKGINTRFSTIIEELLALIPTIEGGIQRIAKTVDTQKSLHTILLNENERYAQWLGDIYNTARSSAVLEIALEAMLRRINNLRAKLMGIHDDSSFVPTCGELNNALDHAARSYDRIVKELMAQEIGKLDAQSSERSILQLVSETNQLYEIIQAIAREIQDWLKTNDEACEALSKGVAFYSDVTQLLIKLNRKMVDVKKEAALIASPLRDLTKITERSKILGLYAGIESARSGVHATALGIVTDEIKDLAERTSTYVRKIADIAQDMSLNMDQLSSYLAKCMSDVDQGIGSLEISRTKLLENKNVLTNLTHLAQEMIDSTGHMKSHCNELSQCIRDLNSDYNRIKSGYRNYIETVSTNTKTGQQIRDVLRQYDKNIRTLKRERRTIVYRQSIEPILLDPANKTDARSHEIIEQIFSGLFTFDSANQMVPGIAEAFSVSKDGCVWDFVLKKNLTFHDGSLVRAQNVADMVKRVKQGPNVSFIDYVESVVIKDERHVQFILRFPYLPFLANLACGACDITPSRFHADMPIGCGPYRLTAWDREKELCLEVFEDFVDGHPSIDRVYVKVIPDNTEAVKRFKYGEIDLMQVTADMVHELDPATIVAGPVLSTQYIGINVVLDTPFKNMKVRQAMNYAIDKERYASEAMEGQAIPGYGVFPPGMYVFNRELTGYPYDLDRARALMKEAGYGSGLDGTYPLDIRESPIAERRAEFICHALNGIGIRLVINPMPWKDFLERGYRGESILCMKSWVSDNGDPDNFLYPLFHSRSFGRAGNSSWYENPLVDKDIEAARSERSSKKRCAIYRDVEKTILQDAPWIFLSHGVDTYAVKSNIEGFRVDPFGIVRFRYLWSV
jgi:ABC-type transport system substrate-binding protein/methyl-accepting chemotaxis protein